MTSEQSTASNNTTRIAKNTVFLYIRTFITMVVSLYTSRVVLNALGVEDFGIWGVLGGIVAMFSFINSSLSSSIFRFLTHAIGTGEEDKINKTYSASIIVHIGLAILIFILCETIGRWFLAEKLVVPDAKRAMSEIVFHIVIITSCVSLLSVPFNSAIIAYERMNVYAYMSIIDVVFKLAIAYIVYVVPSNKLVWYAIMMLATTLLVLLFYYLYVRIKFKSLRFQRVKDPALFKSLLGFSGWSILGNLAYVGYTQGLNLLINMFFGPIVNAARSISLQIEQTVRKFVGDFQTAVNPQIIKNAERTGSDAPPDYAWQQVLPLSPVLVRSANHA
jgi:O-antigen/teichoic acid export membrane protein